MMGMIVGQWRRLCYGIMSFTKIMAITVQTLRELPKNNLPDFHKKCYPVQ